MPMSSMDKMVYVVSIVRFSRDTRKRVAITVRTRLRLMIIHLLFHITSHSYLPLSLANPVPIHSILLPLPQNSYHARSTSTCLSPSINRDSSVLGGHHKKQGRRESKPYNNHNDWAGTE